MRSGLSIVLFSAQVTAMYRLRGELMLMDLMWFEKAAHMLPYGVPDQSR